MLSMLISRNYNRNAAAPDDELQSRHAANDEASGRER